VTRPNDDVADRADASAIATGTGTGEPALSMKIEIERIIRDLTEPLSDGSGD
jgi:hypothetical protein